MAWVRAARCSECGFRVGSAAPPGCASRWLLPFSMERGVVSAAGAGLVRGRGTGQGGDKRPLNGFADGPAVPRQIEEKRGEESGTISFVRSYFVHRPTGWPGRPATTTAVRENRNNHAEPPCVRTNSDGPGPGRCFLLPACLLACLRVSLPPSSSRRPAAASSPFKDDHDDDDDLEKEGAEEGPIEKEEGRRE